MHAFVAPAHSRKVDSAFECIQMRANVRQNAWRVQVCCYPVVCVHLWFHFGLVVCAIGIVAMVVVMRWLLMVVTITLLVSAMVDVIVTVYYNISKCARTAFSERTPSVYTLDEPHLHPDPGPHSDPDSVADLGDGDEDGDGGI